MTLALGIAVGFLLPIQASINSRLQRAVVSPFLMSLVSFTCGLLFLFTLTIVVDGAVLFPASTLLVEPPWVWLGGLLGVIAMTTNVVMVPKIGTVQAMVIPLTGQILMGLAIDHFGWFALEPVPWTWVRGGGVILMLVGVLGTILLINASGRRANSVGTTVDLFTRSQEEAAPILWLWRGAGLGVGALFASQAAVNGQLGTILGSPLKASFISFLTGAVTLLFIVVVLRPRLQLVRVGGQRHPWWMWFGGMLGALYVAGNAYLVPNIGAGATIVTVLLGMMTASLLVDHFGWFNVRRRPVVPGQLVTLFIMGLGVVLIRLI